MALHPRCLFGLDDERRKAPPALREPLCPKPASSHRFHLGKSGKMDRLAFYCCEHAYDKYERHPITDAILERARAEGWPFIEWPPPPPQPPTEEQRAMAERIADWIERRPWISTSDAAKGIREQFGNGAAPPKEHARCPSTP